MLIFTQASYIEMKVPLIKGKSQKNRKIIRVEQNPFFF